MPVPQSPFVQGLYSWGDVALYACAAVGLVFILTYWVSAKWWRSREGRNIMALSVCIVAILLLNSSARYLGQDYTFRPWARLLVYLATLFVVVQRIRWLVRAQVTKRKRV